MTFDHKIELYAATSGWAAMASKTESKTIVRKMLVAQGLQPMLVQTAIRHAAAAAQLFFGALWTTQWAGSDSAGRRAGRKPRQKEDRCLW